jgi:hypothetical protein
MVSLTDICLKPLDKDCATQSVLQVFFLFLLDDLYFDLCATKCLKLCKNEFVPLQVSGNNFNRTLGVPYKAFHCSVA